MWTVDFTGIGVEAVTMLAASGLAATDEGKVVKISDNGEADVCAAEDVFYGVLSKYDEGGGVVAVIRKGFREVGYTGSITAGEVELVADGSGGVKAPSPGVQAVLATGVEANDNAIDFIAKVYGTGGHDIRVQLKDPGANSQALSVDVVGKDIIVSLATDGSGDITSTAADIITAIGTSAAASLVTADNTGTSNGTGVVVAEAITALSGGVNASVGKKYDVVSVDSGNSLLFIDFG